MEDYKLNDATNMMVEELMEDFGLTRPKARKLLANVLYHNIVIAEIKNEAAWILETED